MGLSNLMNERPKSQEYTAHQRTPTPSNISIDQDDDRSISMMTHVSDTSMVEIPLREPSRPPIEATQIPVKTRPMRRRQNINFNRKIGRVMEIT